MVFVSTLVFNKKSGDFCRIKPAQCGMEVKSAHLVIAALGTK